MKKTALIMAGGKGERLWPKSTEERPKQFISITADGKTMIQLTVDRLLPLIAPEDIYIATNCDYRNDVIEQLPQIPHKNIICEPCGRNTAPCIGLGVMHMLRENENAVMAVLPSDHLITKKKEFLEILKNAFDVAEKGESLVTIGIKPEYPETGYGYIKYTEEKAAVCEQAYKVERFVEKPDLAKAKKYCEEKCYLWNSGMFLWKLSSIVKNMRELIPDTFNRLMNIYSVIGEEQYESVLNIEFGRMLAQSIDYAIMEKANDIFVLPGEFGWDDVGSWLAIDRINEQDEKGNTVTGNVVSININNCIIEGDAKPIIAIGLDDLIIVNTEEALLVCSKSDVGDIKSAVSKLKED